MTIFGIKISGAHYNPAISIAYMFRKDVGHFPRILGVAYIIAQILGGFVGALLSWLLIVGPTSPGAIDVTVYTYVEDQAIVASTAWSRTGAIIAEPLGTFFVTFFYLTQTEKKTLFSKEPAINCFIIAASYIGARTMVQGDANTNSG